MTVVPGVSLPEWTEIDKKRGLDPLGMQNTCVAQYQKLLPGISNVTLRVRYYGLYAWLAMTYAKRVRDTDPKTWQRYVRRTEALYALVAQRRGHESGVAGTNWAQSKLRNTPGEVIEFGEDAEPGSPTHYLKQAWGAYGAAYGSQLFEIGVLDSAEDHAIPVPSQSVGEQLAADFAKELGVETEALFESIERGSVTRAQLDALAPLSPSEIRKVGPERDRYQSLLFAEIGLDRPPDTSRRQSLLLALQLAKQLGRTPGIDDIRWGLYSQHGPDGKKLVWSTDALNAQRRRWWAYQANDLAHICLEVLLKYALDQLEPYADGLPLARLIAECVSAVLEDYSPRPVNWNQFLGSVQPADNAWAAGDPNSEFALSQEIMKSARPNERVGAEGVWAALKLLAVLHHRVIPMRATLVEEIGNLDGNVFRSLLSELDFLDAHRMDRFADMLVHLIEERIARRHMWIALQKLGHQGDYTFLIEADDGKVRLRAKDGPVFTNPRLGPAVTFLKDIHLLDDNGLTARGEELARSA